MRFLPVILIGVVSAQAATVPDSNLTSHTKLYFEPNLGQAGGQAGDPANVQFFSRSSGALQAYFKADGVFLVTRAAKAPIRMQVTGVSAAKTLRFEAEMELPSISAYFIGNDRSKWLPRVPNYDRVRAKDVYPGIDLVFYGSGAENKLEYDFVVRPGADPKQIEISFSGVDVKLTPEGDLNLSRRSGGALVQRKAHVHQGNVEVTASYRMVDASHVRLDLGDYDTSAELVVDPVLDLFIDADGSDADVFSAAGFDAAGSMYMAGDSESVDFPILFAFQGDQPLSDAVIRKYDANGALVYSTYLGGSAVEFATSLAVSPTGVLYVAGYTGSRNFPTAGAGAVAHQSSTNHDWFLVGINPFASSGVSLSYATCFPVIGSDAQEPGIALAQDGAIHMAGYVLQPSPNTRILKVILGVGIIHSTTLVGVTLPSIAVDASGAAYITGTATPSVADVGGLPVVNALQSTKYASNSGVVGKLIYTGPTPSWDYLTYIGGTIGRSQMYSIAVSADGRVAVGGEALDGPLVNGSRSANTNYYLAVLNPRTSGPVTLAYATYPLAQFANETWKHMVMDSKGAVYIAGKAADVGTVIRVVENGAGAPTISAMQSVYGEFFLAAAVSQDRREVLAVGRAGQRARARRFNQGLGAQFATNPSGLQFQVDGVAVTHGTGQTWVEGETHQLNAPPFTTSSGVGYAFGSWVEGGLQVKSVAPGYGPVSYTANFTATSFRLSVTKSGNGTVVGGGINCAATCSAQVAANTSVTLLATAASGWTFMGWTGGPCSGTGNCSVPMDAVKTVNAVFVQGNGSTMPGGPLFVAIVAKTGSQGGVRTWRLTATNTDTIVATNPTLSGFTLTQTGGITCTPVVQSGLPSGIDNIPSGSSSNTEVVINFAGCAATARFTVNASVTANGGSKTGSMSISNQFQ